MKSHYPNPTPSFSRFHCVRIMFLSLIFFLSTLPAHAQEADTAQIQAEDVAIGLTTLVLQPVYLGVKLAIAITGTVLSGLTLVATGGDEEAAETIFKSSIKGPC